MQLKMVAVLAAACWVGSPCKAADAAGTTLAAGLVQCDQGSYSLAVETLGDVYRQHPAGAEHLRAAGALGLAYMQMRQPAAAQRYLREAFDAEGDPLERARYGLDLANLEARQRHGMEAERLYQAVLALAPADAAMQASVALNRVPLAAPGMRLALLEQVRPQLAALSVPKDRAAFLLNLGMQARALGAEAGAQGLAYGALFDALAAARLAGDARLMAAAQNQLAQLYEDQQRADESLLLTTQGIASAQAPEARDLLIALEWRRGRLLGARGQLAAAVAAFQRAVDQIEAVRQDIPVEYENGRSSFRDTLEPVYLGLADLLLQQAGQLPVAQQGAQFLRVRETLELIKQTELEDFLGSRCAIEGARRRPKQSAGDAPIARGTAVLYPVILPDRLELLVETSAGIERRTVAMPAARLRRDATEFAAALRARRPYLELAQRLHDALLAPAVGVFERESIDTVVVVPDTVLRLVPFGALHDGQRFAIEKYAFAVVPAVTLPDEQARRADRRPMKLLLAGVSEPGMAVARLPGYMTAQLLADAGSDSQTGGAAAVRAMFTRGMQNRNLVVTETPETQAVRPPDSAVAGQSLEARNRTLQRKLALAGVVEEIDALASLAPAVKLLNQDFSVRAFSDEVRSGNYRVVHIASHGVFGATAEATFVMAHDDLITIDQLQAYLRGPGLRGRPIELLTLSACETAEGDDRAPLGLSGAALKAQAESALGSLWPVSDDAAQQLMASFYGKLVRNGSSAKAKALQQAQVRMIGQDAMKHPYFWAPFILVERRL